MSSTNPRGAGRSAERPVRRRRARNTPPIAGEAPVTERSQHHIYPPLSRPWVDVPRPAAARKISVPVIRYRQRTTPVCRPTLQLFHHAPAAGRPCAGRSSEESPGRRCQGFERTTRRTGDGGCEWSLE
jgi:hypothetical protein